MALTDEQTSALISRFAEGQKPIAVARETGLPVDEVIAAWRAWNQAQP